MTFTVGGVDVTAVHVGPTAADAVYAGSEKVWPTAPAVPVYTVRHNQWANAGLIGDRFGSLSIGVVDANGVDQTALLSTIAPGNTIVLTTVAPGGPTVTVLVSSNHPDLPNHRYRYPGTMTPGDLTSLDHQQVTVTVTP